MKRIIFLMLVAASVFSCEKPIYEFQSENFLKFFGTGYESKGNDVIQLSEGGYVFTGYDDVNGISDEIFIAKADKNGNLVWSASYGLSTNSEEGKIIKEDADGFIIAGTSTETSGLIHSFIMKINQYGDSVWYKEFGEPSYSIVLNDIAVSDQFIFVAGESYKTSAVSSDYYLAKLDLEGNLVWDKINFPATGSKFTKAFLEGENLLLIGTDGSEKKMSVVTILQSSGNPIGFENTGSANETVADATLQSDMLYVLVNTLSGTKLYKLNLNLEKQWETETINSVTGKSLAYTEEGNLFICGESVVEGTSYVNTIKVDATGEALYGPSVFRTFQGTLGKVLQTGDKGLILIGTTATFGANIQLIKTDKDYFMLKP
jgi:hypothetical protein